MSNRSDILGRGFEFIFITELKKSVEATRPVEIKDTPEYGNVQEKWNLCTQEEQENLKYSAIAGIEELYSMEPLILNDGKDLLELSIQPDSAGEKGDVRDVLLIRRGISWEIGVSLKHNHEAVKHSRLSRSLDFANSWFQEPCTPQFWEDVASVFEYTEEQRQLNKTWNDLGNDKIKKVYMPLLKAFVDEINRQYSVHGTEIPKKMVEYLLGKYDFYKVIGRDATGETLVEVFNMNGTLNQFKKTKPRVILPVAVLPRRIVHIGIIPNSTNKVEIILDKGWAFTFRIHNASTKVENSVKFDIQLEGKPAAVQVFQRRWIKEDL
ncbi:MAG: HaeIII family restriction endonuclease [Sphaerochaetaceae bacterium]|nr:HaeIII family restriction endonuclease [Sphaerochaetaceae bacterium]